MTIEELFQTTARKDGEQLLEQLKLFTAFMQEKEPNLTSEQLLGTFVLFQIARLETMIKENKQTTQLPAPSTLSSWICSRCRTVHSILKMSCDCKPTPTLNQMNSTDISWPGMPDHTKP